MDTHANFAYGLIDTAPSPATSGTSLTLATGVAALMPATPFNATVWPVSEISLASNAEIIRVTNITGDVATIVRAQEGTVARTIVVGDQIAATITKKTFTDIETAIPVVTQFLTTAALSQDSSKYAGINGAITGGSLTVNTSGVSINLPSYLTTAALSADSSKYAGTNGAITGGSITVNTAGVSVNLPAYLTTAALSADSSRYAGTNGAITGGSITVNTSGISVNLPAYLTTAALSGDSSKYAFTGFTTTTVAGAVVAGTHNTAGLLLAVPGYLTTADLSQNSSKYAGINGAITGGSITVNTSGVSVNLPAYLTTAALSGDSSKYAFTGFTTTTVAGAVIAGTHNTQGLLLAVPGYLTTAALSANTSNYAGINSAITGGSMTVNTSGVSINLPAYLTTAALSQDSSKYAGTAGAITNGSITVNTAGISVNVAAVSVISFSAGTASQTFGSLVFSNSNGYSFGLNGSSVTMAGPVVGYLEPYPQTNTAGLAPVAGSWYLAPFVAPNSMSGGRINFLQVNTTTAGLFRDATANFVSNGTGGKNQSGTFSLGAALFSQGIGGNSTRLESFWSNTFSWGWSHRLLVSQSAAASNVSISVSQSISYISEIGSNGAYTLNQFASASNSSGTNTSAASQNLDSVGVSLRNMLNNSVMIPVGFNTTISAGNYWLGVAWSSTTASATSQTSYTAASALWYSQLSIVGISRLELNSLYRNWGSTATTARSQFVPSGVYTAAANMTPPTFIALSSDISSMASQWVPYFNFINQGITK